MNEIYILYGEIKNKMKNKMKKKPNTINLSSKKAAISMSIETLVIIIIALVILGLGITLLYKFIGGAQSIKTTLDEKTDDELERLMVDQGKQVALPLHVADISRGSNHIFGLGILNIGGAGNQFQIQAGINKVINEQGEDATSSEDVNYINTWLLYNQDPIEIEENQHHKEAILVSVPKDALKGQFIFNVQVIANGQPYGNVQKIVVNVK